MLDILVSQHGDGLNNLESINKTFIQSDFLSALLKIASYHMLVYLFCYFDGDIQILADSWVNNLEQAYSDLLAQPIVQQEMGKFYSKAFETLV